MWIGLMAVDRLHLMISHYSRLLETTNRTTVRRLSISRSATAGLHARVRFRISSHSMAEKGILLHVRSPIIASRYARALNALRKAGIENVGVNMDRISLGITGVDAGD